MRATITLALQWAIRAFGQEHVYNSRIRALRVAEEAVELAQACMVPKEKLIELVNIVYCRPVGDPAQELGGIYMTTHIMCARLGYDPDIVFEMELARVLDKPAEYYTKRNQEKLDLGLR